MLDRPGKATQVLLLALTLTSALAQTPRTAAAGPSTPVMGLWSPMCGSSNVTSANPNCGPLGPNEQFTVDVNITSAPPFNGYEFFLYYDQHYVRPQSIDVRTGTLFNNPFKVKEELGDPDPTTIHEVVVNLGGPGSSGTGVLCHITFLVLATGVSPLVLAAGTAEPSAAAQSWSRINLGTQPFAVTTTDGYFKNVSGKSGPVTSFSFQPLNPSSGELVSFNATLSSDPDSATSTSSGIANYVWDFGDGGGAVTPASSTTHKFASSNGAPFLGNFSVRLTVTDSDDGFIGIKTELVSISKLSRHDVDIASLTASPAIVSQGQKVNITLNVVNLGTFSETFDLSITYGPPTTALKSFPGQVLSTESGNSTRVYFATIDTVALAPQQYEVVAVANDPADNDTSNNSAKTVFTVQQQSNSPFLLIAGGGVAVVAALVGASVLLRRRRRQVEAE